MSKPIQNYEFIDWSGMNEVEIQHLQNVLSPKRRMNAALPQLELPWSPIRPAVCVQDDWTIPANFVEPLEDAHKINPMNVILPAENTSVSFQQTNENSNKTSSKVQNNLLEKNIFTSKESLKTDNSETIDVSYKFYNKEFPALKAKNANFVPPKSDLCRPSLFDKKSHLHNSIQNQGKNNSATESITPKPEIKDHRSFIAVENTPVSFRKPMKLQARSKIPSRKKNANPIV